MADACTKPYVTHSWLVSKEQCGTHARWGEARERATVVSEKELKKKEDDAPPHVGWRHRKRHCASWHSTLGKPTLPHDANSVVQNKKGTKPKPKKKTQNTHKGDGNTIHAACGFSVSVRSRSGVFLQLSLEYSKSGSTAHPQVGFYTDRSVCAHETTDER